MKFIYTIVVSLLYCIVCIYIVYKKFRECLMRDYHIYNALRKDILVEIEIIIFPCL